MARFHAVLLATLAVTASTTVVASAQTPLEQAKALTEKATIEYQVAHFDQALVLYSKAYELFPKPALLFDIGQCHRMLGNSERAIFFYQGYLRAKPDAPNRPLVEQLLDESRRKLDAQRAADAEKAEAARRATPQPAVAPAPTAAEPVATAAPGSSGEKTSPAPHPNLWIAGLATAGAGVVLLGTAVYFGLHAASLSDEISQVSSQHGTWSDQYASDYESGKSAALTANVLYVVGGLALATGGVLAYLGWPHRGAETRAAIAPVPGGAALAVGGRF